MPSRNSNMVVVFISSRVAHGQANYSLLSLLPLVILSHFSEIKQAWVRLLFMQGLFNKTCPSRTTVMVSTLKKSYNIHKMNTQTFARLKSGSHVLCHGNAPFRFPFLTAAGHRKVSKNSQYFLRASLLFSEILVSMLSNIECRYLPTFTANWIPMNWIVVIWIVMN